MVGQDKEEVEKSPVKVTSPPFLPSPTDLVVELSEQEFAEILIDVANVSKPVQADVEDSDKRRRRLSDGQHPSPLGSSPQDERPANVTSAPKFSEDDTALREELKEYGIFIGETDRQSRNTGRSLP